MRLRIAFGCSLLIACASNDADFHVRFPAGAPRSNTTVSILGVYKDGRLAPESWETLGAPMASVFSGRCAPGFDDALAVKDLSLASAIDDYARANGPSDALLDAIAPAAKGDAIVVLTVAGRPPHAITDLSGNNSGGTPLNTGATSPPMRGRGMRSTPMGMAPPRQTNAYELAATIYNPKTRAPIGFVGMTYTGQSAEEAMKTFIERLKNEMPADTCAGWDWNGKVEAKAIESIKDE